MRTLIKDAPAKQGEEVVFKGWVDGRRDHGKIIFLDIRDRTGTVQVVATPSVENAEKLRNEYVVSLKGLIKERPDHMKNDKLPHGLGDIEVEAIEITILNEATELPLAVGTDGYEIGEEVRMHNRYLDIRRPRMTHNLRMRHKVNQYIRNYLTEKGFVEVETPYLTKATPEGARDYLVPSRMHAGDFYALPQSPQQYKQLLMVSGLEQYFQIVRCFRDEDLRGDRQPEFTQLDLEMSFVSQEDVLNLMENLYLSLVKELYPDKKLKLTEDGRIPRMTHAEAAKQYNSDRPDLRDDTRNPDELAFCFVVDFPMFEKKEDGSLVSAHHPFTLPTFDTNLNPALLQGESPEWQRLMDMLKDSTQREKLRAYQYDLVLNGYEISGGSIRTHEPQLLSQVFQALGHTAEEVEEDFGHMLKAFTYGAPPHGGFASGLDRIVALLQGEPNIREVIAFPKTGDGRDLMIGAPTQATKEQLDELHVSVKKSKK